ncbi:MAG: SusC/RagA family TonB-linked outer membrane protein [Odoribacter sp.]|nr:SusC/RagA family TonB-linked outer membrane protein [Odoribacter sp.]
MNKLKYIIIVLLLLFSETLLAQTAVLSGRVYETINGKQEPALAVNVIVANSQNRYLTGTTTGMNGEYNLRIPSGEGELSIIFSFVGMKTQTIKYTGQTVLDITLEPDQQLLDEFVISERRIERNDLGISEKQQVTATQRISMDEIMETSPVTSIEEALQGRLGGVDIVVGGDPGSRSSIRIRGTSSLNASTEPLIVIDGVPYSVDIDDTFEFATANEEDYGQLLNIAPADIESIEVLKDAAATAIWGTEGANGVLLIKTKRGNKGKTRFNVSSKFSVNFEPKSIPMLDGNQYVALMQDAIWNTANAQGLANSSSILELLFNTPEINYQPEWRYFNEYNQNTKWLDEIKRNAYTSETNFSMSGGGDKANYRLSLNYANQQGTTIGTGFDRFNTAIAIDYNFSERLKVSADFYYSQVEKENSFLSSSTLRSEAIRKMPNKSPYWIDAATGKRTSQYFSRQDANEFQGEFNGEKNFNPVAMAKESYNDVSERESRIKFLLQYSILPGLTYEGWVNMQITTTKSKKFLPQVATGVIMTSSWANRSADLLSDNFSLKTENKLLYIKNFNVNHSLIATGVLRTQQNQSSNYTSVIYGAASPNLDDPTTGGTVESIGSSDSETRSISALLSVHYTLFNKYIIQSVINASGNSSMGKSKRWGYFPTVGVAWWLHEENFLKEKEWLELAKLRVSYGQSGNSPSGSAPYIGTFNALSENYMNMSAIAPNSIQLNNLKWETSSEYNIGFDLLLLQSRLSFTFDYYNKLTKDLLQKNVSVPSSTGFSKIAYYNSGELRNQGLEFRVDATVYREKDWDIRVNANINRNVNKIIKLPENLDEDDYSFGNGNYAQRLQEGTPVGSFFGYKYQGVYQNTEETYARDVNGNIMRNINGDNIVMKNSNVTVYPGDAKYEDINYDGAINRYDIVYIGNGLPVLTGGGGFTVKYKTVALTAFFHGRFGQKVINRARMNSEAMYGKDNQSRAVLKRWRNEGDDTEIPRALYNYGYNYLGSDRFVEKASYLRLKTLSLNYSLPKRIIQRWGINNLNFYITGYDLFTWTKYTGQDPEVKLPSSARGLVIDDNDSPVTKRFAAGFSLNF